MKTSQVFWGCLGTTMGAVFIGVQPVLGLTWVLTGSATITTLGISPTSQPNCCSGSFDFNGTSYSAVNIIATFTISSPSPPFPPTLSDTFNAITNAGGNTATTTGNLLGSMVSITFDLPLATNSPAGTVITFSGSGKTSTVEYDISGTVTAVPYEFESATGLAILAGGYGLHKLRRMKSQQYRGEKSNSHPNSQTIPAPPQLPNPPATAAHTHTEESEFEEIKQK